MERIKLSVWITTYNHEAFIAQALDSVLMQQTDFDFEIIIGEDCSTDQTRTIVLQYKQKYPEKIRLYLPEKNLGMGKMFEATYAMCQGEYLAWLDGDDYWTDPNKLQSQVDFLDNHPEFILVCHNVRLQNEIENLTTEPKGPRRDKENNLSWEHFLKKENPIFACSVVHRNKLGQPLPEWISQLPFQDLGMYYLLLDLGKIKYMPSTMATYRIHQTGNWSGKDELSQLLEFIAFYRILSAHVSTLKQEPSIRIMLNRLLAEYEFEILTLHCKERKYYPAFGRFLNVLKNYPKLILRKRRDLFQALKKSG